ncbi:glycoside hydrolase family 55 protein [Athelia psychrophila]|uniref:Glycoside hydrolase family 55 protein n=1 Tax=Athelia psychrophila TaxID=1759441 RepID=A0A166KQK1_9AGAM|nr:glycoside hydrolase family 55 protein [Fibularhizoctonia sp. CBS 109695]
MAKRTNCPTALGAGTAIGLDAYWHEGLTHRGLAAFNIAPSAYNIFPADDTDAINVAITDGPLLRPVQLYHTTPALIYSPQETHVYTAIELYYHAMRSGASACMLE